jgi:hypothetical protein
VVLPDHVRAVALLFIVLLCSAVAPAYSVLPHEEIVDLLWTSEIRVILLTGYPGLSDDQIREDHADLPLYDQCIGRKKEVVCVYGESESQSLPRWSA